MPQTTAERFWARVDLDGPLRSPYAGRCWLWTGGGSYGYGSFRADGRTTRAHRFAYELLVGPIEAGLVLDHLCRVKACVNPVHLEAVTQRDNVLRGNVPRETRARRGRMELKSHCPKGHPYTDANTYVNGEGYRECRTCRRERRPWG